MKIHEIQSAHKELIQKALKAMENAYSPYSQFRVGAAVECMDGTVFTGCNVENSSYGLTVCAERVALFKAVSEGRKRFHRLAVVGDTSDPILPCGACLQVLAEFNPEMELVLANTQGKISIKPLKTLLPMPFRFGV